MTSQQITVDVPLSSLHRHSSPIGGQCFSSTCTQGDSGSGSVGAAGASGSSSVTDGGVAVVGGSPVAMEAGVADDVVVVLELPAATAAAADGGAATWTGAGACPAAGVATAAATPAPAEGGEVVGTSAGVRVWGGGGLGAAEVLAEALVVAWTPGADTGASWGSASGCGVARVAAAAPPVQAQATITASRPAARVGGGMAVPAGES